MSALISVIIPAHNSEKTLYECCNSIIQGVFQNFEIIIVENNSSDNTLKISNELSQLDKRIKTIVTTKVGPAAARNIGMNHASGMYYSFVDSDDYVDPYYLFTLYKDIRSTSSQLSICGYTKNELNEGNIQYIKHLTQMQAIECFLTSKLSGYVWDKLFKANIIKANKLYFREDLQIGEDRYFVLNYLLLCDSIVINSLKLYCYVQNDGSLCNQKFSQNRFDLVKESIYELITVKSKPKNIKILAIYNIIKECIRYVIMAGKQNILSKEQYEYIKLYLLKFGLYLPNSPLSITWKLYGIASLVLPYSFFMRILKRKGSDDE